MVFAFAGDSTMTRRRPPFVLFVSAIQRATIARSGGYAILAADDAPSPAQPPLFGGCSDFVADPAVPLPLPGGRTRESAARRGVRPGGRTRVESRSLAARAGALATAVPPLHGEVG